MKCINCGNEVQDGVVTCPFCNSNLNNQVPVTPSVPVLPQDQNMVVTPEAPVVNPTTEPIAEVKETPVAPVAPVEPVQPAAPEQPTTPVAPETPVAPTAPEAPAAPQAPTQPTTVNLDALASTPAQPTTASVPPMSNQGGEKIGSSAPVIENKTNKKKNMIIMIVLAVVLVLGGLGVFGYFYEFKSADKRLEVLSKNLFSFTKNIKNDAVELSSGKYSINGGVTADDETISFDLDGTYGVDLKNEILDFTLNANSIKVGEELLPEPLNVEVYLNDSKAYLLLQNFYDKYIFTEVPEMKEMFESLGENDINYVVLLKGVENAFTAAVKSTSSTQSVEDVTINGKKQKANVVRIVATAGNQKLFVNTFFKTLANNKAFVKEFAKVEEKTEEEAKEEILSVLEDAKFENEPNTKFEMYSPIVGNSLLGVKVSTKNEDNEQAVIEVYPVANGYAINMTSDGKSVLKGQLTETVKKTSKTKNSSSSVSLTMFNDDTTVKIDVNVNVEDDVNPKVEKVNVKNSVDARYLTEADQQKIITNISNYGNLGMLISQFINQGGSGMTEPGYEEYNGYGTDYDMDATDCANAFNCVPTIDGTSKICKVCDDNTQTCVFPDEVTCPVE